MKRLVISFLRFYQRILSPDQGIFRYISHNAKNEGGGHCVMYPTCSEYMVLAVEKYGVLKGIGKGIRRIFRCHPFQKKLVDMP